MGEGWPDWSTGDCGVCAGTLDAPGGVILETDGWIVDHCIGPLPLGTLIVKPKRHCEHVGDLTAAEAVELGLLLRRVADCVRVLTGADQAYVCLWSHAGWEPVHVHFVVQPAWNRDRAVFAGPGPATQVAQFAAGQLPDRGAATAFAARAREVLQIA